RNSDYQPNPVAHGDSPCVGTRIFAGADVAIPGHKGRGSTVIMIPVFNEVKGEKGTLTETGASSFQPTIVTCRASKLAMVPLLASVSASRSFSRLVHTGSKRARASRLLP